jgi:WD40 repeat protein
MLQFLPDGRGLLGAVSSSLVHWDLRDPGEAFGWVDDYRGMPFRFALSRCGRYAAVAEDRCLVLWDVAARKRGSWREAGNGEHIADVAFSPDGREVFTVLMEGGGVVRRRTDSWRKRPGFGASSRRLAGSPGGFTGNLAVSPNGRTLATNCGQDGEGGLAGIKLWDLPGGAHRRTVTCPHDIYQLAYSPDGRTLAARGGFRIGLYDARTLKRRAEYAPPPGEEVLSLAFHPAGRVLGFCQGNEVRLVGAADLRPVGAFDWKVGRTFGLTFSPDGMLAAVSGENGRVVVWDVDL